jgi:RNase P subunit RPR2
LQKRKNGLNYITVNHAGNGRKEKKMLIRKFEVSGRMICNHCGQVLEEGEAYFDYNYYDEETHIHCMCEDCCKTFIGDDEDDVEFEDNY